ncbi:phospholipase A2 inhibitor NAI-like [Leptodactylus fuscus]
MFLLILSLFSLVTYGDSLSCISCHNGNEATCVGGSVVCPENYQCLSLYMEITINGSTAKNFFRSCAPVNHCNMTGSSSFPDGTLNMAATCCTVQDRCTPSAPLLATTNNTVPNGVVCRQCQSINSDQCNTQNTKQCYGNENMCIRLDTTTTAYETSALAFRGCATRSVCDVKQQLFKTSQLTAAYNYICTSAAAGFQYKSVAECLPLIVALVFRCHRWSVIERQGSHGAPTSGYWGKLASSVKMLRHPTRLSSPPWSTIPPRKLEETRGDPRMTVVEHWTLQGNPGELNISTSEKPNTPSPSSVTLKG